jgi:hypothetical protein
METTRRLGMSRSGVSCHRQTYQQRDSAEVSHDNSPIVLRRQIGMVPRGIPEVLNSPSFPPIIATAGENARTQ